LARLITDRWNGGVDPAVAHLDDERDEFNELALVDLGVTPPAVTTEARAGAGVADGAGRDTSQVCPWLRPWDATPRAFAACRCGRPGYL
jgi:hypothetical protein